MSILVGQGPYVTAITDLRNALSDGPEDRYNYRKRCFGDPNGINVAFKTFDGRRLTDFTVSGGVFVDGIDATSGGVATNNLITGEFTLVTPPTAGQIVEGSYYSEWFLDSELDTFLQIASRWCTGTNDYTTTSDPLIDALIKYACAEAYLKMAMRWRTYLSEGYKVEDSPKDSPTYNTDSFLKMSQEFRQEALTSRTEFFNTRQGRAMQPLSVNIFGGIRRLP